MPLIVKDRVQETSTTTGTGTFTLAGAVSGFQTFSSAIGNGNTTYYAIVNGSEWEVGLGTVAAGTLARTTVIASSTGSAISFSAGTKNVFCTYPASQAVTIDGVETLTNKTLTSPTLTTPALGTPASGTLTNCTGYTYANLSGTVPTWNQNTTGTAANVTGTVAIANGGTGATTRQNAMDALAGAVTSGQYLRGNGTDVVMAAIVAGDVPTLNQNTTGSSGSCTGNAATATTASNTNSVAGALGTTNIWTGVQNFTGNGNTGSSSGVGMSAYSTASNGAIMAFHRSGVYAVNFGLDSDNVIRIGGWSASANRLQMDMSGNLTMAGNVTAYSDERKKKNWRAVTNNFVEKLAEVKSGVYERTDEEITQVGVSAQSFQELLPEAVLEDNSGFLSVAYGNAALTSAVELAKELVALKTLVKDLKEELDQVKATMPRHIGN